MRIIISVIFSHSKSIAKQMLKTPDDHAFVLCFTKNYHRKNVGLACFYRRKNVGFNRLYRRKNVNLQNKTKITNHEKTDLQTVNGLEGKQKQKATDIRLSMNGYVEQKHSIICSGHNVG